MKSPLVILVEGKRGGRALLGNLEGTQEERWERHVPEYVGANRSKETAWRGRGKGAANTKGGTFNWG